VKRWLRGGHETLTRRAIELVGVCAALGVSCGYPAAPPSWSAIGSDEPARKPDVPFEASSDEAIDAMLALANPGPNDVVFDLGCGDGRVVIRAVERTGARGVCVDLDPQLVRRARENARRAGVEDKIRFRTEDLFTTDIHDASVVMLFLWPEINLKLLPKLQRELPSGARIVSNMHDMGAWPPERRIATAPSPTGEPRHVYLWRIRR
jgi:SAM-dependent methyltransferase